MTDPSFKQKLQALVEASQLKTPLRVARDETWPFAIFIVDAAGSLVTHESRVATSSDQKTLADVRDGVGFRATEADAVRSLVAKQEARIQATVELFNAAPAILELLEAAERAENTLQHISEYWNGSPTEGAMLDALEEILAESGAMLSSLRATLKKLEASDG